MIEREQAIGNWQTQLRRAFTRTSGVFCERVQQLNDAERAHHVEMNKQFTRFATLMGSYQDFALQSLEEVSKSNVTWHVISLSLHVAAMKRLRCALGAFESGYYFSAIGDLRGVYEITLYIGGVLKGLISFNDLAPQLRPDQLSKMARVQTRRAKYARITNVEKELRDKMWGCDSQLDAQQQSQLRDFMAILHTAVHRGEADVAHLALDAIQNGRMPEVRPRVNLNSASSFANPATFLCWTHFRTLQYVSWPTRYSPEWQEKFVLLDESFRFYFTQWAQSFADAILRFMETSFCFDRAQASKQVYVNDAG